MPTCPRCALLALVIAFAAFSGCDANNPGNELDDLEGTYAFATLLFDPTTQALPDVNVAGRLDPAGTSLEIFGSDEVALLRIRFVGDTGARRTDLRVTASRGRVTFEALTAEDEEDLRALLLPRSFSLEYNTTNPASLSADLFREGVNLELFDPAQYQDQTSVRGTLSVRLNR
jgi:hypothetical protein